MNAWKDNRETPLKKSGVVGNVYEIRYLDEYNVTRTVSGVNGYPFGVFAMSRDVDGSKLPGAQRGAWGEVSKAIPYGRIKWWKTREKPQ